MRLIEAAATDVRLQEFEHEPVSLVARIADIERRKALSELVECILRLGRVSLSEDDYIEGYHAGAAGIQKVLSRIARDA
jgi:hypothetical protein